MNTVGKEAKQWRYSNVSLLRWLRWFVIWWITTNRPSPPCLKSPAKTSPTTPWRIPCFDVRKYAISSRGLCTTRPPFHFQNKCLGLLFPYHSFNSARFAAIFPQLPSHIFWSTVQMLEFVKILFKLFPTLNYSRNLLLSCLTLLRTLKSKRDYK